MGSNRTVAISDDDEESNDQENVKDSQRDSGIVTGPVAGFIDPDQSCSSTSALANRNEEDLVRTLLELDIKSMFNDMNGNNKPTILSTGYLRPHPSPEEIWNPVKLLNETFPRTRDKIPSADKPNLLDRHNRIMAAILTRFRNMVLAATEPLPTAAAIPQASLNAMTMNNEVSALIKEIENLLALNREIKKLWIAGPLRKPGDADEKNREKEIDEKASQVSKLYNTLVELESEIAKKSAAQQALVTAEEAKVKKDDGNIHIKHEDQSDSA